MQPDPSMHERLLAACRVGQLMSVLDEIKQECPGAITTAEIARELAVLHNEAVINIVDAFSGLREREFGPTFFSLRGIFEHALPDIESDVLSVICCVKHLTSEAGQDLAAGTVIEYFMQFLSNDPSRASHALDAIKSDSELHALLPATLIIGCRNEFQQYLEEALALTKADDPDIRRQAVFALGGIEWPGENRPCEEVYSALEEILEADTEDGILATTARTAARLIERDPSQADRLIRLVDSAVGKGGDMALHEAASILHTVVVDRTSEALIDKLLVQLSRVNPQNKGTVERISDAISRLIRIGKSDVGIDTLETLIAEKALEFEALESALHAIQSDTAMRNKVITRWLLNGNVPLCNAAAFIVSSNRIANIPFEVDPAEIDVTDVRAVSFLAHKICGFFFDNAVSAASMLLSLLQLAPDNRIRVQIGQLIYDPLLINYPGKARAFIQERKGSCSPEVQLVLDQIDGVLDEYFQPLRTMNEIPEFCPTEAQREAYQRHNDRKMELSFKEAEKRSVLLSLIPKRTMLYGRTSVHYVHDREGNTHRQEVPLQEHSVEFEMPRMWILDPLSLEYQLARFRAEKRQE